MKFSPTVPTSRAFHGPPITPLDPVAGYIQLPVSPLQPVPKQTPADSAYGTITQQFRQQMPQWQRPLFGSLRKAGNTKTLLRLLQSQQPIIIVSDASVQKNGHSGFAWVIAKEADLVWRGLGLAPGPVEDIYSGRAEAYGILTAIIFLQYYLAAYDTRIPVTTINCFCDNMGILNNMNALQDTSITRPNDTTNDDQDIYLAIDAAARQCVNVEFQYLHVKGHQDKDPQRPLLVQEQHNVECDRLAKQHILATKTPSTTYGNPEFDAATPHLQINGKIICRKFIPALCEAAAKPPYWNYLQKKFQWTHSDTQNIHWSALNLALRSLPREDQWQIILFNHNKLPLQMSKFHPHLGSQLCPSC